MQVSFWKNKKVLITGHTGFKGSWLALWLDKMGAKVLGVSLPDTDQTDLFSKLNGGSDVNSHNCDISDREQLAGVVNDFQPDVVLHLAAQALVRESYKSPVETFRVNVMGTLHVLEAVRNTASVGSIVCVTSDKCYENKEWIWGYRESDRLGGHAPCSNSKACAELVVQSFRDSFFPDLMTKDGSKENSLITGEQRFPGIATARAGNVIGGGDASDDRLLPDLIRGFNESRPVEIRNPYAVRPWQHVLEPLSGYLLLAENLYKEPYKYSQAWNFGPVESGMQTVEVIADLAALKFGNSASWVNTGNESQPHEAGLLKLDCSKARYALGWEPVWSVETAVNRTVEWDTAKTRGEDMREYSLNEITEFESAAHHPLV